MKILGIESSCDDTSVALVQADENGFVVLSEKTASQIDIHKKYGGVVPEVAGRAHAEKILPLIEEVLKEGYRSQNSNDKLQKPDVIAVTAGPGLMTGLLVGTEAAKTLSYLWDVPLIGINHIEGHIHSVLLPRDPSTPLDSARDDIRFPALCLIVSGGHTELILMHDHGEYELVGKTRDDAAGEAFDKIAKLLGLEYPGGPKISKLAENGDPTAISFPRPMLKEDNADFSFSGLKTAALYWLQEHGEKKDGTYSILPRDPSTPSSLRSDSARDDGSFAVSHFCASFQQAITDVLIKKTLRAAKQHNPKTIILGGGVSANKQLRGELENQAQTLGYKLLTPNLQYAMDNAAMIAVAAYHRAQKKQYTPWRELTANPNWKVYE